MIYYYKIDIRGNFHLTENNVDERSAHLNEFEVKFLRKVLENELLDGFLQRLDYLRGALEAKNGIELKTYYVLIKALVNHSFQTNFEVIEPRYYVHVLPTKEGYLNVQPGNDLFLDDNYEWGNNKTKFTREEIQEMKFDEQFKNINFDTCLERVEEDD